MIVVDASALFEVVANTRPGLVIRDRLAADGEPVAPHIIDVEVLGVVRRRHQRGELDDTGAHLALMDLEDWAGERFIHRPLLARAWDLRQDVRSADAVYVALAEALDAPLLTLDAKLAKASGPRCAFEVIEA